MKNWSFNTVKSLFAQPFIDLMLQAQTVQRENFNANEIRISSLLSVKTGACGEDCAYCPQSKHYNSGLNKQAFLTTDEVIAAAKKAKKIGATHFCVSASGKMPAADDFDKYITMVKAVKQLGLNTCATLGTLNPEQVQKLAQAGLDFYNHNIDTSAEFYSKIITTRTYDERLETLSYLAKSSINICCGMIVGMGENETDRINALLTLAKLPKQPSVIPINRLIKITGTPLENAASVDDFDFIKMLAVARIMFPKSIVALAAGRNEMSDTMQAWCFLAGANAMHIGEKLLTTPLPNINKDRELLSKLGLSTKVII